MSNDIYFAEIEGKEYQIEIVSESTVNINGTQYSIDYETLKLGSSCSLLVNGNSYEPNAYQENGGWEILLKGRRFKVKVEDDRERRLRLASGQSKAQAGRIVVQSPMPGLVIDIPVQEGDLVEKGEVLVILESMKMQNELRASRAGKITRIHTAINENVERKETLLTME